MKALELNGVGKCYGSQWAVRGVDLHVAFGERLALLGHNGAGKTTLMKLCLGLIAPEEGTIRLSDGGTASRPDTGFLPENVAFHDAMTGRETLRFYARLKRRPDAECDQLLENVGLSQAADRRVVTYSKGMRQRLGLAQALLGEPRLLLLDEPTTGLDPASRQSFYGIIDDLARKGAAILLSSHMLPEVEGHVDRIQIMDRGRKVISGTLAELREAAGIPTEITLKVRQESLGAVTEAMARFSPRVDPAGVLSVRCGDGDKMEVLARAAACQGAVTDLDMVRPDLDALYTHFVGRDSTGQEECAR